MSSAYQRLRTPRKGRDGMLEPLRKVRPRTGGITACGHKRHSSSTDTAPEAQLDVLVSQLVHEKLVAWEVDGRFCLLARVVRGGQEMGLGARGLDGALAPVAHRANGQDNSYTRIQ